MHNRIPRFILQKEPLTNQNSHGKLAKCFDEPTVGDGGHLVWAEGFRV